LPAPGDVVILATPPAFRWVHFSYAIEKGLNVFMEKPVSVDGPDQPAHARARRARGPEEPQGRGGPDVAHSRGLQELARPGAGRRTGRDRHAVRLPHAGADRDFRSLPKPEGISELEYQLRRFHSFLWASGGGFNDFFIHIIDQLCWMKNAWPVKAQALGGRHYRARADGVPYIDQNLDSYAVEYTYATARRSCSTGATWTGCQDRFLSFMHGTKGSAIVSANGDCGAPSIHTRRTSRARASSGSPRPRPARRIRTRTSGTTFVRAIRDGVAYNEAKRGIEASLVCNMGRMAAHTGREITFEEMLECKHEFAPGRRGASPKDSVAPVLAGRGRPLPRAAAGRRDGPGVLNPR
jgi:predicted dehydrogenase